MFAESSAFDMPDCTKRNSLVISFIKFRRRDKMHDWMIMPMQCAILAHLEFDN